MGKFWGAAKGPEGKFGNDGSAERENLVGQARVLGYRIDDVDAGADGNGFGFGGNCAAMASGVDAARHALMMTRPCTARSHAKMAGTDHSDTGQLPDVRVSANIKNERRIVDLLEPGRIGRIVKRDPRSALRGRA